MGPEGLWWFEDGWATRLKNQPGMSRFKGWLGHPPLFVLVDGGVQLSFEASVPPKTPLQKIIDPFVEQCGGEIVSRLVSGSNLPSNADYLFRQHGVIAELKALESNDFAEVIGRKYSELTEKWYREGKLIVFGSVGISSSQLRPECREELFDALAEPLQTRLMVKANKQIKSTKELLVLPNAKGLLWVASDGNEDLQPDLLWYLLTRILRKKKPNGKPAYSAIDGLVYFNPRMPATIPQVAEPLLFWFGGARRQDDLKLEALLSELYDRWFPYLAVANRISIRPVEGTPDQVRFFGVPERRYLVDMRG